MRVPAETRNSWPIGSRVFTQPRPAPADPYYPRRIERAEKKLQVEYRRDCMHGNRGGNING
jgi:hypothetical protein